MTIDSKKTPPTPSFSPTPFSKANRASSLVPSGSRTSSSSVSSGQDPLLALYLKEISKYPLLTLEEEQSLTKELAETGNIEVAKKLVLSNLRLVVKIALEYKYAYTNTMDLIQEGNIGLMKAVSKYDPDKGAKLSYYASWWIKSYILKFILDNFRLVKLGTTNDQKKLFYNLLKEKERLEQRGEEVSVKKLSENLGVSEKNVVLMEERLGPDTSELSLDYPLGDSFSGTSSSFQTYGDLIEDKSNIGIEEELSWRENLKLLEENLSGFVAQLSVRDREIFQKRLLDEAPMSLQSIADLYGVTRERIRQIEVRLIHSLKEYMAPFLGTQEQQESSNKIVSENGPESSDENNENNNGKKRTKKRTITIKK